MICVKKKYDNVAKKYIFTICLAWRGCLGGQMQGMIDISMVDIVDMENMVLMGARWTQLTKRTWSTWLI